jgi:hypothetical protein
MSGLVAVPSLREFFKQLLLEVTDHQRVHLAEVTEFYLVNLLAEFAAAEKLFAENEGGKREQEPLALLYYRALQQGRSEKIRTLRRLGDISLYRVGFFSTSLRDSPVGPDYYIQMGGRAYGQLADLARPGAFANAYQELCVKFRALVTAGPDSVLKVYESWVRTGSDRLERVLVDAGIVRPKNGLPN